MSTPNTGPANPQPEYDWGQPRQTPQQPAHPRTDFGAKFEEISHKVGTGARKAGAQARASVEQTRRNLDTPDNRAKLGATAQSAGGALKNPVLPAIVYAAVAILSLIAAFFPWFTMRVSSQMNVDLGFLGGTSGSQVIEGKINGFGLGEMTATTTSSTTVFGASEQGPSDAWSENITSLGVMGVTVAVILLLVIAALLAFRGSRLVGGVLAVVAGVGYLIGLLVYSGGRVWDSLEELSLAGGQIDQYGTVSNAISTDDSGLVTMVMVLAFVTTAVGIWQIIAARTSPATVAQGYPQQRPMR